ncbi:hypothetical protein SNE40_000674 [Patella caerulea]|uniref:Uncharacterized protein n=1 Tax=Patella caerulea TaxID=87958 RepID=A0AAN8KEC7_PATCE
MEFKLYPAAESMAHGEDPDLAMDEGLIWECGQVVHVEAVPTLKKLMEKIHSLRDDPMSILTKKDDAFGRQLDSTDQVLQSLQTKLDKTNEAYLEQVALQKKEFEVQSSGVF